MAVKSNADTQDVVKNDYPKLMISEQGRIVLFEQEYVGVVVNFESDPNEVGRFSNSWSNRFRDYRGKVVLSNKEEE